MTNFIVIIPARYASSRLPAKPLQDIGGITMIQQVWQQSCKSAASRVVIATDDSRIERVATSFGAEVCMTRTDHMSGTDRLQEVASKLNLPERQILVNVQGDEPFIPPAVIDQVANNLTSHELAGVATLSEPITNVADFLNPNVVKVVTDSRSMACYFSRAPIPWPRDCFRDRQTSLCDTHRPRRHIGIYSYRVSSLESFVSCPMPSLETLECLEQLRFIYHGIDIHVADARDPVPSGIDTEEDLHKAVNHFRNNSL